MGEVFDTHENRASRSPVGIDPLRLRDVLAGGGVKGGYVHGAGDNFGAKSDSDDVTPADLAATIYWRFGLDPATEIRDERSRPFPIAEGTPIRELFG